jgi:hypothetical protein
VIIRGRMQLPRELGTTEQRVYSCFHGVVNQRAAGEDDHRGKHAATVMRIQ